MDDGFGIFSKFSVDGLNRIIQYSRNAEIVLTTSHKNKFSLEQWHIIFKNRGIVSTRI